jgi:multiple sugar transport system substrate-binding protein
MQYRSEFSRRSLLKGIGVATGAAALAACSGKASTSSSSSTQAIKKGTLTVMCNKGEISDEQKSLFETAYPDLKLEIITSDQTRLNAMLAAGSPPDLVRDAGTDVTPYIASRSLALNLDPYFAKSTILKDADILPINDVWKWDGTTHGKGSRYGLAKDWSQDAMYWCNTDMWTAAGVALPTAGTPLTYDAILEAAKKLTKSAKGKTTLYGLWTTAPRMNIIASMVATAGGRIMSEDLATADLTSPEAQQALTWLVAVAKAKVGYTTVDPSPDWDGPEFFAKHQAMANAGYWFTGYLESTAPKLESTARLAAAPLMGTTRVSPSFGAVGFWIPTKSKNPGGAFAFLEWFCGGDGASKRAAAGQGLPSMKSMLSLVPQKTAFEKAAFAVQQAEQPYLKVLPVATPYAQLSALDDTLTKIFPEAVTGSLTIGALADKMTKAINDQLTNGKKLAGK